MAGYDGDPQPLPPRSARGSRWATAPATYTLVGINCAVYLAMVLRGVSPSNPSVQDLVHWGANFGGYVLAGQWWRLLTAAFVHVGILHLATNMWCLWNLGLLGEPLLGPAGSLPSIAHGNCRKPAQYRSPSANCRGRGLGRSLRMAGVLILLLKAKLLPVPPQEIRRLRKSVIYFALLNFVIGGTSMFLRTSIQIDNMAHLGGFLCGLALGAPLVPRIGAARSQFAFRSWAAYGSMTVLLLVFALRYCFVLALIQSHRSAGDSLTENSRLRRARRSRPRAKLAVGMTILFGSAKNSFQDELSSRAKPRDVGAPLGLSRILRRGVSLAHCGRGKLLDHSQQQLAVAVVQVSRVAPDLSQKPQFVVGELLGIHLPAQRVFGEKLSQWDIEGLRDLGQGVE